MLAERLAFDGHRVTATEVNFGSFALLRDNLQHTLVDLRRGEGLLPLKGCRYDLVVIAGMGYDTILTIMERRDILAGWPHFIVQPMQGGLRMHQAIVQSGWTIIQAELVRQRDHYYPTWLLDVHRINQNAHPSFVPGEFRSSVFYRTFLEGELQYRRQLPRREGRIEWEIDQIVQELERIE